MKLRLYSALLTLAFALFVSLPAHAQGDVRSATGMPIPIALAGGMVVAAQGSSGFRSPSMVGISSDTVGWMCTARWITV